MRITYSDRTNLNTPTGATTEVPAGLMNELKSKCIAPGLNDAWSAVVKFDDEYYPPAYTMTGNIEYTIDATNAATGNGRKDSIVGNGGTITFTGFTIKDSSLTPSLNVVTTVNGTEYTILFLRVGGVSEVYIKTNSLTADTTPPTVTSATVENADPDALVVVFDEAVTISDTTGLSLNGSWTGTTITGVTGSGTNTLTFALDTPIANGESGSFVYGVTNNIIDGSSNGLVAGSIAVTNNTLGASNSLDLILGEDKYITLPDVSALDFATGAFSISAWIKVPSSISVNTFIVLKRVFDSFIDYNLSLGESGKIAFSLYNADTTTASKSIKSTAVEIAVDTWYCITATYDGNTAGSSSPFTLYKDNSAVTASHTADGILTKSTSGQAVIGKNLASGQTNQNLRIAQLSFWNKELSLSEHQEIYNSGSVLDLSTHSAAVNLVAYYEFAGSAIDSSGNGYNGIETNIPAYSTDQP